MAEKLASTTLKVVAQALTVEGRYSGTLGCLRITKNGVIYVKKNAIKRKKT